MDYTQIVKYELSYEENIKRLLNMGFSDTYIEAVLYARYNYKRSISEIAEDIKTFKEVLCTNT